MYLDKALEIEMIKLGLANEKKKEEKGDGSSQVLRLIEHQKKLCKNNPNHSSCSKNVRFYMM